MTAKIARIAFCSDFQTIFNTEDERTNVVLSEVQGPHDFRRISGVQAPGESVIAEMATDLLRELGAGGIALSLEIVDRAEYTRATVPGDLFLVVKVGEDGVLKAYIGKHDSNTAKAVRDGGATPPEKMIVFVPLLLEEVRESAFSAEDLAKLGVQPGQVVKHYRGV